jgi:hypothetical protein
MESKPNIEICYFPVEINIDKAGEKVKIEKALPLLFDKVEGVTILNPGYNGSAGTLELSIGGEEIFPSGFHAGAYMCHQGSFKDEALVTKSIDSCMCFIEEKAQGATISATYLEPAGGDKKRLYLFFKLTRQEQ